MVKKFLKVGILAGAALSILSFAGLVLAMLKAPEYLDGDGQESQHFDFSELSTEEKYFYDLENKE